MNKFALALVGLLLTAQAYALPVGHKLTRDALDSAATAGPAVQIGTQLVRNKLHVLRATYSYAVQGGSSLADINLLDSNGKVAKLPVGAIVREVLIYNRTAATTASQPAPIAISLQSAGDLKAATAYTAFTGLLAGIPIGTAATAILLTAERSLTMDIATFNLTAGKFDVLIQYELTD